MCRMPTKQEVFHQKNGRNSEQYLFNRSNKRIQFFSLKLILVFRLNSSYATELFLAHRAVAVHQVITVVCAPSGHVPTLIFFKVLRLNLKSNPCTGIWYAVAFYGLYTMQRHSTDCKSYTIKYPCAGFRYRRATSLFKIAQVLVSFKFTRLQLVVRAKRSKCEARDNAILTSFVFCFVFCDQNHIPQAHTQCPIFARTHQALKLGLNWSKYRAKMIHNENPSVAIS